MSFRFRAQLLTENTIFGTEQATWKERLRGKSVLEENIRTVPLPPTEISACFALNFISNLPKDNRIEEFCYYQLENYIDADSTFPPPLGSQSPGWSPRTTNACESLHAHFNALFDSAYPKIVVLMFALQKIVNETYINMRSVTARRLKKISYSRKR
jgi:hypothetical protein